MVTPDTAADDSDRERGQLVLTAAIGIGLVIVGLVVVINTVLVSENLSTSESLESSDEVTKFSTSAQRNTRSLVLRLNHWQRNQTGPQIGRNVRHNVSNYSRALGESYAETGISVVNLSYNNDSSTWGTRIVQTNDSWITDAANDSDWTLFESNDHANARRFVFNLNTSHTSTDQFNVTFDNGTETVEIGIQRKRESIAVSSERSLGGDVQDVMCDPSGNRVLIDLMTGEAFTGDCEFNGVLNRTDPERTLEPPYTVSVADGEHGFGKFSVVTNSSLDTSSGPFGPCDPQQADDLGVSRTNPHDPCRSPIVWRANITTTYQSTSIDYWQQHNVSVYP
ncbi:hypothetical protein ACFR9U_10765 [Halorientalis brevis]|uniref:Flagellin n=1 Tax=Halorientalis brevis TaxID=1126241 RepID=A0ABD6CDH2_9EURY|nr:hypothetical protein [Halorientalis brevis]